MGKGQYDRAAAKKKREAAAAAGEVLVKKKPGRPSKDQAKQAKAAPTGDAKRGPKPKAKTATPDPGFANYVHPDGMNFIVHQNLSVLAALRSGSSAALCKKIDAEIEANLDLMSVARGRVAVSLEELEVSTSSNGGTPVVVAPAATTAVSTAPTWQPPVPQS